MVTGIGSVNQPQSAGVITSTSTIGNQSVIQGTPAGAVESSMPPRRTNDNRRSNKPIMEKRRRARINNCLNELKTLILDAMKKDPARHSKLEKADILEMTVKHLENLQRQQVAMTAAADPSVINKFRAGFSECASEVGRFPGLEPTVKRRLLQHLANCLQVGVGTIQTTNNNNNNNTTNNNNIIINKQQQQQSIETTTPILATQAVTTQQQPTTIAPSVITTAQTTTTQSVQLHILPTQNDQFIHHNGIFFTNGNGTGVQLLPTRLPNGDIALVLPTSIQTTTAAPTMQQQQQQSVPQKQQQPTQQQQHQQQQQQIIYQRTTLSPSQQSQNSHSNSASPLPMLIPIPTRTASASSVASSSSGVSSMPPQANSIPSPQSSTSSSPHHYTSPNSPQHYQQHRYEPMDTTPLSPHHHQNGVIHHYSPPMSKPLSLVIRKTSQPEEEKPWRPW